MGKRLSDEQLRVREWKKNRQVKMAVRCKCGRIAELLGIEIEYICSCKRYIIHNYKLVKRNCVILFKR